MAHPMRRQRVAEQIHQELGSLIQIEIRDPRLGWTTVTRVEMSPDLAYAKIFVSVLGDEPEQEVSLKVLNRAASYLRGQLGRRVRLRAVPELRFLLDHSFEHSQRIMDLLNESRGRPSAGDDAHAGQDAPAGEEPETGDDAPAGEEPETGDDAPDGNGPDSEDGAGGQPDAGREFPAAGGA